MKKIITVAAILFGAVLSLSGNGLDKAWDRANTLYINGDYKGAIMIYDSIASSGHESAKLYYNLGNAYFKESHTGKAIVNYRRALNLSPSDHDIKYNLSVAQSGVKDNIEQVPQFFVGRWINATRRSMSSNAWAVLSLLFFGLTAVGVLLYLLSNGLRTRKAGFTMAIVLFALFLVSASFAAVGRRELTVSNQAVVIASAAPVKSSPDRAGKDVFILHEGTEVEVVSNFGEWAEIMIADGHKGWIAVGSIEKVEN